MKKRCTAILLAAGAGRRMESSIAKQYMLLGDKPVIWYGLQAFEKSALIDTIILVVGKGEIPYAREEIVNKYGFSKVDTIIEGGEERYLSVKKALTEIEINKLPIPDHDYVFIHDGARPFITDQILKDTYEAAVKHGASCAAMPVKDTIKVADRNGFVIDTPERSSLFSVQTPQVFSAPLIMRAYRLLSEYLEGPVDISITDDAMVVEHMIKHPVKLVPASYENIKITTPDDLEVAESLLNRRNLQSRS